MNNLNKFILDTISEYLNEQNIDEANIYPKVINYTLKMLGIDEKSVSKIGEGANGVAFKYGNKIIKMTSDFAEAEFAGIIKGHKLNRVANVYEVYEIDFGDDYKDNKSSDCFGFCRYYWVIIKDFIPYQGSGVNDYYNLLLYFDNYQLHNFDYSETAFNRMINDYYNEHLEMMSDEENYDPDDDYELQDNLEMLNYFKELHMELQPLGILSVSDMKESNMGRDENAEPVWFELHIYRDGGYQQPELKKIIATTISEYLNENYSKDNLDVINDFYPEYYKNLKNKAGIVGWPSKKEQDIRFEVLLNIGVEDGETVLDFGCGLGGLYEYMTKHYNKFRYIGVDINQEFIDKCKKKYPKVQFKKIDDITDIKINYDWFIASGAFTVYTPIEDMIKTIKKAFKQVKYGIAINFLENTYAKNSDLVAIRGYDKKELYKLFSEEFKEFHTVELHDGYIDNDFTIYLKKKEYFN